MKKLLGVGVVQCEVLKCKNTSMWWHTIMAGPM